MARDMDTNSICQMSLSKISAQKNPSNQSCPLFRSQVVVNGGWTYLAVSRVTGRWQIKGAESVKIFHKRWVSLDVRFHLTEKNLSSDLVLTGATAFEVIRARSLQSCLTLCDPMDCSSPPGSSVHGILQARILEWAAMPSSRGSSWPRDWTHITLYFLHWQAGSLPLGPQASIFF